MSGDLVDKFKSSLRSGGEITIEHRNYTLIKELYHCTPSELGEQEEWLLDLHYSFLVAEGEHEEIRQQREEQKRKLSPKK